MEEYRAVKGYEGLYEVSSHGDVRNVKTGRSLAKSLTSNKYYKVKVCKDRVITTVRVHRLVAEAFIINPCEYDCVDHRDEDRLNNHYTNLRWCTQTMNINYYWHKRK